MAYVSETPKRPWRFAFCEPGCRAATLLAELLAEFLKKIYVKEIRNDGQQMHKNCKGCLHVLKAAPFALKQCRFRIPVENYAAPF